MKSRHKRRQLLLELLGSRAIQNQHELRELLAEAGCTATQATISRDLRDLGVVKSPGGYLPPSSVEQPPAGDQRLREAVALYLLRAQRAGNLVVIRTAPGHAQPLALAFDQSHLPDSLGTIAGDDTIFLATKSPRGAARLVSELRDWAGLEARAATQRNGLERRGGR